MQNEKKVCPCCASSLEGRWEGISKGLVNSLIQFREAVLEKQENCVHLQKDVHLTKNQYNNFQKLRYHGLVAHAKDKITKEYITGYWLLTRRGNLFIKNKIELSKEVLIFRKAKIIAGSTKQLVVKFNQSPQRRKQTCEVY